MKEVAKYAPKPKKVRRYHTVALYSDGSPKQTSTHHFKWVAKLDAWAASRGLRWNMVVIDTKED